MNYTIPIDKLRSQALYADLNSLFGQEGKGDLLYGREAVRQAIFNIFRTAPGEAGPIFQPDFGSLLPMLLQEPLDERTAFQLRAATIQALQRWEPRIEIDLARTDIVVDNVQPGYRVTISYVLRETGDSATTSFLLKQSGQVN